MVEVFILVPSILLGIILLASLVSFFVHTNKESIKAVIRIRTKYGKIYNPIDASWLFYRELYESLPYTLFNVFDHASPVLIGQFIWKEPISTLEEKLRKKYPN